MKKRITALFYVSLLVLIPIVGIGQTQIQGDIDGLTSNSYSGSSVALSADGSIVVIGSHGASGFRGIVRVFQNVNGERTQIGNNIFGEAVGDFSGMSVAISADGSVIAIGATQNNDNGEGAGQVRVYKNISGEWEQVGEDIDGEAVFNNSGNSVSLSADGNIVAIGAYLNDGFATNAGHVRIYQNVAGVWQQIGEDIDGTGYGHFSGYSLSLSADGNTVAIGSPYAGSYYGYAKIYRYINGNWEKIGDNIVGIGAAQCGRSISLSADGNIVAVGAPFYSGPNQAQVRVYHYNGGVWQQIGASINGDTANGTGHSVSISADGSLIAIGNIFGSVNGANSGQVRLYKNISDNWTQVGADINGEAIYDQSGIGLSLSGDGSTLAIGAQYNTGNGTNAGHVRIFDLSDVLSNKQFSKSDFTIYPNPTANILNIETRLKHTYKLQLVNGLGQLFLEQRENASSASIDVSTLSKGLYFLIMTSEETISETMKFIKN